MYVLLIEMTFRRWHGFPEVFFLTLQGVRLSYVVRKPVSTVCRKVDLAGLKQATYRKLIQSPSRFVSPR